MGLRATDFLIDDETINHITDKLFNPLVDGERKGHGLVPRDYSEYPESMFEPPSNMPLIPRSEWSARIKELEEKKALLSDLKKTMGVEVLDQNGDGYCWAYSTGACVMTIRAINNQPYHRLSPHAVAAIIKRGRDEGGWCGLSAQFLSEHGIPTEKYWARHSRSLSNDTPEMRANAALHKVKEEWVDLTRSVYDRNLTFDQVMSCLLSGIPCAVDFNHWGHSVEGCDPVEVEAGSYGIRICNSWTPSWGDQGYGVLRGSKAIPNGAVALRTTTISLN